MKQKIVIKISSCCSKCRTKALKITAVEDGVMSMALEGDDKDTLAVIGETVDAACLTEKLRKKINYAELVSVEEVKPPADQKKPQPQPNFPTSPPFNCQPPPHFELVDVIYDPNPTTCSIM